MRHFHSHYLPLEMLDNRIRSKVFMLLDDYFYLLLFRQKNILKYFVRFSGETQPFENNRLRCGECRSRVRLLGKSIIGTAS